MGKMTLFIFAVCLLGSCRDKKASVQLIHDAKKAPVQTDVSGSQQSSVHNAATFDVPTLLPLSSLQVRKKLGPPIDELQADAFDGARSLVYSKNGLQLTVDYFVENNQVDRILLAPTHDTTAYQFLLPAGNLIQQDTTYTIEPQPGEKPGYYHGILIKHNPPLDYPASVK